MKSTTEPAVRRHLLYLLHGGGAHIDFESLVSDLSVAIVNRRIAALPYTIWHVLEHMRIAQWDILEFSRNPQHASPEFPKGYWPNGEADADAAQLERTISAFRADLTAMEKLVEDSDDAVTEPIHHGDGQTLLREALLVADHNAYHLGTLAVMKRILMKGTEEGDSARQNA